jgi:hypothetical protein
MKITKNQLSQIIKEELQRVISEAVDVWEDPQRRWVKDYESGEKLILRSKYARSDPNKNPWLEPSTIPSRPDREVIFIGRGQRRDAQVKWMNDRSGEWEILEVDWQQLHRIDELPDSDEEEILNLSAPPGGKVRYNWESGNSSRPLPQHRKKKY